MYVVLAKLFSLFFLCHCSEKYFVFYLHSNWFGCFSATSRNTVFLYCRSNVVACLFYCARAMFGVLFQKWTAFWNRKCGNLWCLCTQTPTWMHFSWMTETMNITQRIQFKFWIWMSSCVFGFVNAMNEMRWKISIEFYNHNCGSQHLCKMIFEQIEKK